MSAMIAAVRDKARGVRNDPMMVNSGLIFLTTTLMAGAGAIFWVVAARLQTPENVGLAGSLVSASDSIALFAQLGLNITVMQTMPVSRRKAADATASAFVVVLAGTCIAVGYCLLLPVTSPRLAQVLSGPWTVALFSVLVGFCALNILTDSLFLSVDRIRDFLKLNGILLGVGKLSLPFVLGGAGAVGLYSSVAGATLVCGVASLVMIVRHVGGRPSLRPSAELLGAKRFAGAGYLTYALYVTPQLVLPLLVINALGAAHAGVFFISTQIVTLQNAINLAVGNSMYAEGERNPHLRREIVRRGGRTMAVCAAATTVVMLVVAPYLLQVFGSHYAQQGALTLRILSFSTLAFAFNYWSAMQLRLSRNLRAMVLVQLAGTGMVVVLAALGAPHGTEWAAAGWGVGQLVGGLIGFVVSRTVAPIQVGEPLAHPEQEEA